MKKIFISLLAALTALTIAVPAFADDDRGEHMKAAHSLGSTLEVHINDNGKTLVRGAKVTAVSGNTITATTAWGSVSMAWTVNTNAGTEFVRKAGGASNISEVSVGDFISFYGMLVTTTSGFTVNADIVKDWSVQAISGSFNGTVQSVNVSANSFVLASNERGTVTVMVSGQTSVMKGDAAAVFADIVAGASVQVKGVWNTQTNTIAASRVTIKVPKIEARTFEGTIKSISATTLPTVIVLTVDNIDYTVNVAANISILNNLWLTTSLANFHVGDRLRVYGTVSGTTIQASVVRDTSIRI